MNLKEKYREFKEWQLRPYQVAPLSQEEHTCATCGTSYQGNYCPRCGQSSRISRYSYSALEHHRTQATVRLFLSSHHFGAHCFVYDSFNSCDDCRGANWCCGRYCDGQIGVIKRIFTRLDLI